MEDSAPIVFLVHGTWPRGILSQVLPAKMHSHNLAWFDEGSLFRTEMQEKLAGRVQFEAFNWSGRNSMKARAEAASKLRERLIAIQLSYPRSGQFIVAHSHGGNVALQAVARLDSRASILGVATMATPFLYIRERPLSNTAIGTFQLFAATALLALALPIGWLLGVLWRLPAAFGAFATMFIATGIFCIPLAIWTMSIGPQIRSLLKKTLADAFVPALDGLPLLTLRCPGDEASLALALARAFAAINSFLWKALTLLNEKMWVSFGPLACAWIIAAAVIVLKYGDGLGWSRDMQTWIIIAPAVLILLTYPASFISVLVFSASSGFLLLPFGAELWVLAFILEARADAKPPVKAYTHVNVDSSVHRPRSLRHSVYEVRAAREKLAEWIAGRLPIT